MRTGTVLLVVALGLASPAGAQDTLIVGNRPAPRDITEDRGLFVATARALPAGRGYVSVSFLWTPAVAYGVTDRFTLVAGSPLWTLVDESGVAFASAKYEAVRAPGVRGAFGVFGIVADQLGGAFPYFAATVGTDRVALTGLGGVGVGSLDVFERDLAGTLLGQMLVEVRPARQIKLFGEFLQFFDEGDPAGFAGVRLFGRRWSVDLAVARSLSSGEDDVLPWAAVAVGW